MKEHQTGSLSNSKLMTILSPSLSSCQERSSHGGVTFFFPKREAGGETPEPGSDWRHKSGQHADARRSGAEHWGILWWRPGNVQSWCERRV